MDNVGVTLRTVLTWSYFYRQAAQKPGEDSAGYGEDEGSSKEEGEVDGWLLCVCCVSLKWYRAREDYAL